VWALKRWAPQSQQRSDRIRGTSACRAAGYLVLASVRPDSRIVCYVFVGDAATHGMSCHDCCSEAQPNRPKLVSLSHKGVLWHLPAGRNRPRPCENSIRSPSVRKSTSRMGPGCVFLDVPRGSRTPENMASRSFQTALAQSGCTPLLKADAPIRGKVHRPCHLSDRLNYRGGDLACRVSTQVLDAVKPIQGSTAARQVSWLL
jgi:hypothetical protein